MRYSTPPGSAAPASTVLAEARRRRAFAVISHPDAGKSTLTEALALHASAITRAGAVHGKAGRRGTEVLTRRHDGALLALFSDKWRLGQMQREHPGVLLEPLIDGSPTLVEPVT